MTTIDVSQVASVYSGRANKCACGCAGKHTYAQAHRQASQDARGYRIDDTQVNDRIVKRHVNTINNVLTGVSDGVVHDERSGYAAVTVGDRMYVAYFAH